MGQRLFVTGGLTLTTVDKTFIKNWAKPGLFLVYFRSFQTNSTQFLQQINLKKMSCPSSIWHRDSNSRPSEYEPPPITTRPGLPHNKSFLHCFILELRILRHFPNWHFPYHQQASCDCAIYPYLAQQTQPKRHPAMPSKNNIIEEMSVGNCRWGKWRSTEYCRCLIWCRFLNENVITK